MSETRVEIPVQFIAAFDDETKIITRMTVLPWESYAGYFGEPSEVIEGDKDLDVKDTNGPFWRAMQQALAGDMRIGWEE